MLVILSSSQLARVKLAKHMEYYKTLGLSTEEIIEMIKEYFDKE
jgi:hypothetical protein